MRDKNNGSETITIKYFSMFSGIGGFEYGLQQSKHDFENVGFSEIDKYAVSIYEKNYPNHINYGDATKIKTEELPDFDFLVGGFPCQAFSVAGKRGGFNDTRGTLFFEIARILKDKNPHIFYLKMLEVYYLTTKDVLSRQSLGFSPTWGISFNGRYLTQRISKCHNEEKGCLLKDILEEEVPEKYYLSEETAAKILLN